MTYLILKLSYSKPRQKKKELLGKNNFPKRVAMLCIVPDKREVGCITVTKNKVAKNKA